MDSLKEKHDQLLAEMPEGGSHDSASCAICNVSDNQTNENSDEGGDKMTYTEEEFNTAVKEAVAPLQAEADAKVSELQTELETLRANKAVEEAEGQIAEVKAELDKAELRATEAEKRVDEILSWLEEEAKALEHATAVAARRDGRIAQIKEVASFSDEYIENNIDRWVALEDEAFEALLEDWKAVSQASREVSHETPLEEGLRETAMSNVRDNGDTTSAADVLSARSRGIDVRYL